MGEDTVATKTDGERLIAVLCAVADAIEAHKDELTELDRPIGDSDHGINMSRGFSAVAAELPGEAGMTPADILKRCGMTLVAKVGGSSGPLYGTFFRKLGVGLKGLEAIDLPSFVDAMDVAVGAVMQLGKATEGEKTMVDAMAPVVVSLKSSVARGEGARLAFAKAGDVAFASAVATIPLRATKGRASYLGERSVGHQDPGATSFAYMVSAVASCYC